MSYPINCTIGNLEPGKSPTVTLTYQCEDEADVHRTIREASERYELGIDITYDINTRQLTMTVGAEKPEPKIEAWLNKRLVP